MMFRLRLKALNCSLDLWGKLLGYGPKDMRRLKESNGNPDLDGARWADLEEIGQFISKDNPPAAEKVGSMVIREAENVAAFPRLGRIVPEFGNPQIREIISQSYRITYKFDEEGNLVAILRIWHGARGTPQLPMTLDSQSRGKLYFRPRWRVMFRPTNVIAIPDEPENGD